LDITVTVPDNKLQLLADVCADAGFVDPGGTLAERRAALSGWLADRYREELVRYIRRYNLQQAVDAAAAAELPDPLA
jgi:hypothetical protein